MVYEGNGGDEELYGRVQEKWERKKGMEEHVV